MDIDDEDPAWLEACMAAVDSMPVANLATANESRGAHNTKFREGLEPAASRNRSLEGTPAGQGMEAARSRGNGGMSEPPHSPLLVTRAGANINSGTTPLAKNSTSNSLRKVSCASGSGRSSIPTASSAVGYPGHSGISSMNRRDTPRASSSWPREGYRRMRGVGANPDDHVRTRQDREVLEDVDPCWRCGEPVRFMNFGTNQFFGCSSHPLCKATRKTRKNGAVVELIAEEKPRSVDAASSSPEGAPSRILDEVDPTGITRSQLCVKVRGGHNGGAAQAAWEVLRRNNIIPTQELGETGVDGNGVGSNGGTHAGNTAVGTLGMLGTEKLKAVLDLGKRDAVRRLLKEEGMSFRDIPQSTYSRLIAAGAGENTPASAPERVRQGNAMSGRGNLEPLDACERLLYTLPAGLRETLLPFQRDGVLYGLRRKGRCLIADEMGTGKTLQALGVMGCYRGDWPLLIVAPASMRLMWAEEVEHWYPFLSPSDIHLIRGNKDKLYLTGTSRCSWPRVVIVSYFMLRILADSIGKGDWKAVIFDESHMISTKLGDQRTQAQQVTVCLDVARKSKRVVMLSGTPSLTKPFDLFNQVEAISPGLLGRGNEPLHVQKTSYASNYCAGAMRGQKSKNGTITRVAFYGGSDYPDELHLLLKNEVMIRRLKNSVAQQLPPLRRIVVRVVEHEHDLRRALKAGGFQSDERNHAGREERGGGRRMEPRTDAGTHAGGGFMSNDQRAGLKKVKSASDWVVDKLFASQETLTKFVVFAHHKTVLDRLQEAFEEAGTRRITPFCNADSDEAPLKSFSCLRIDGSVPTSVRASRLSEFNTDELCRVLVVSITAGGQGLDFTAASNVVFVELPESPAWLRQAEDRLHRRRQEKSVNVYLMVLPAGSHDDTRWLSLNEKLTTQTSVVNGTLEAEDIDVDRVCDAGDTLDDDDPTRSSSRRQACRRLGSKPPPQGDVASFGASGDEDDNDFIYSDISDASDDLSSPKRSNRENESDVERDKSQATRELDEKLRIALMSTPMDSPPTRSSQSPTLQLLRQIAESPASRTPAKSSLSGPAAGSAAREKIRRLDEGWGSQGGREGKKTTMNTRTEKIPGTGNGIKTGKVTRRTSSASAGSDEDVFTSPAVSRKRPRCSPESGGSAKSSGNPFAKYGNRDLLSPPSPSSRLGVDLSSQESCVGISQDAGEGISSAAGQPIPSDTGENDRVISSCKADGSASSCALPVDPNEGNREDQEVPCNREGVSSVSTEIRRLEVLGGAARGEEGDPPSNMSSPKRVVNGVNTFDPAQSLSVKGEHQDQDAEELLVASKLFFMVSDNTGRVHVYKEEEQDQEEGYGLDNHFDREGRKPRHCRCNFRPEDLDRLFEAAKQSRRTTTSASKPQTAEACEVAAKSALLTMPKILRSAPALKVARSFVQEWRALSSRKRPLLKGTPCRPPLTNQLGKATPALTGSTRRYTDMAGTKASTHPPAEGCGDARRGDSEHDDSATGIHRSISNKVMCLFCEVEAASEQGPHVHRRDRFCSVDCMEAHGSRSGNSLRQLVLDRDKGICSGEGCGRDCLALVSRLMAVQNRERRRDILITTDPRFGAEQHATLMDKLVRHPKGGHAWHADHVTAVYQGGGECGVDNLRTLCVLCHAEVTRVQTAERAAARRLEKENLRRSKEESQGQRRIVSFGGSFALSAGLSQGSHGGKGGGSQGDACEISSDENDRDHDGHCEQRNGNDDENGVFVSRVDETVYAGRLRQSSKMEDLKRGSATAKRCPIYRERDSSRGMTRPGKGRSDVERTADSSLAAFESIINGDDSCLKSTSGTDKRSSFRNGSSSGAKKAGSSGEKSGSSDSDGSCEIMFTRVYRPHLSSPPARSREMSVVGEGTLLGKGARERSSGLGARSGSKGERYDSSDMSD